MVINGDSSQEVDRAYLTLKIVNYWAVSLPRVKTADQANTCRTGYHARHTPSICRHGRTWHYRCHENLEEAQSPNWDRMNYSDLISDFSSRIVWNPTIIINIMNGDEALRLCL